MTKTSLHNHTLNSPDVAQRLHQLLDENDIEQVKSLLQNRDAAVEEAIREYDPQLHAVMSRPDKERPQMQPYVCEKLPRARQRYINEAELFFLLGSPIKWRLVSGGSDAFAAFTSVLRMLRFDTVMRQAKRTAGAETEAAILFRLSQDAADQDAVQAVVLARSGGYTLRPLFDQYGRMLAFGYGYWLKEGGETVEHFDIETPATTYRARKVSGSSSDGEDNDGGDWEVTAASNPTGKINAVYIRQPKAWEGAQQRLDREERIDAEIADTNNYFAAPLAVATAEAPVSLPDPEQPGAVVQAAEGGRFEYVNPPRASELQAAEKRDLGMSILFDTFTPDLSFEAMKEAGSLSGEALRRVMALGYMKRDRLRETYDIVADQAREVILALMSRVTHVELAQELEALDVEHDFGDPFDKEAGE